MCKPPRDPFARDWQEYDADDAAVSTHSRRCRKELEDGASPGQEHRGRAAVGSGRKEKEMNRVVEGRMADAVERTRMADRDD